jgi:hypothetical protein
MRVVGADPYLSGELAVLRSSRGDVDGTLDALGITLDEVMHADEKSRILVAVALLSAGRGAEAYALFQSAADTVADSPFAVMVDAALAAGDLKGAVRELRALARRAGNEGRIAALGVALLDATSVGRETDAVWTAQAVPSAELVGRAGVRSGWTSTGESMWEGTHRTTSSVVDGLTGRYVH